MNEVIPGRQYRFMFSGETEPRLVVEAVTGTFEIGGKRFFVGRDIHRDADDWPIMCEFTETGFWEPVPEPRVVRAFDGNVEGVDLILNEDGTVTWRPAGTGA